MPRRKKERGRFTICKVLYLNREDFGTMDAVIMVPGHSSGFLYAIVRSEGVPVEVQVYPCHPLEEGESAATLSDKMMRAAEERGVDFKILCIEELTMAQVQRILTDDFKETGHGADAFAKFNECFAGVSV